MTDEQTQPRVSIDADAWRKIDATLADLPYRVVAPLVQAIQETGGVQPIEAEEGEARGKATN